MCHMRSWGETHLSFRSKLSFSALGFLGHQAESSTLTHNQASPGTINQSNLSRNTFSIEAPQNLLRTKIRKILVSVKLSARNSGAGNGCANFMGAWKNAFFLQEKAMSIKFLVLGGVFWVLFGGGGSADFNFYGREDFSEQKEYSKNIFSGKGFPFQNGSILLVPL